MKMLKKLALVSAVSMISTGAFAMEAMDEEAMSATTGQDGITISIAPGERTAAQMTDYGVTTGTFAKIDLLDATGAAAPDAKVNGLSITQVVIHDDDGFGVLGTAATANSGAIVIGNGSRADSTVVFMDNRAPIEIKIDSVGDHNRDGTDSAMLNVEIKTPTLAIKTGSIYVANSNAAPDDFDEHGNGVPDVVADTLDADGSSHTGRIKIMNGAEIVLGATTINIQLGNEAQGSSIGGAMIAVNAALAGGLTINNLELLDQGGTLKGGAFRASSLGLTNYTAGTEAVAGYTATVAVAPVAAVAAVPATDLNGDGDTFDAGEEAVAAVDAVAAVNVGDVIPAVAATDGVVGTDLNAVVYVNMVDSFAGDTNGGLMVTLESLGGTGGVSMVMNDVQLGSATAADLGDVQILGLNMNGTSLIIRGH